MKLLRLAGRALLRDWRGGELRVLAVALLIAVASVASVGFFADRVERAMVRQSASLLGGDLILRDGRALPESVAVRARELGLSTANLLTTRSVALAGDATQLVELRAIGDGYPLRGRYRLSDEPFGPEREVNNVPARGTVWVEPRLLQALNVALGDTLELGASQFRIAALLAFEPDRAGDFFAIAPHVVMHLDDVPATALVQPGSRVTYRLALAGEEAALAAFRVQVQPDLDDGVRVESVRDARPEVSQALDRAERFLGLAALISVVVAGVGVAVSARRFAERHWDNAAILRCFGARERQIMALYGLEFLALGVLAGVAGVALGYLAQLGLADLLAGLAGGELPPAGLAPVFPALLTGLATLVGFGLPPLWRLKQVPPMRVLRRDLGPVPMGQGLAYGPGVSAVVLLVVWQARDMQLAAYALAGLFAAVLVLTAAAAVLVWGLGRLRGRVGIAWRFGLANIARRGGASVVQVVALGLGMMVLLLLGLVRTDLLAGWESSLPADAPNQFLINIQPDEVDGVRAFLNDNGLRDERLYPMVRGRLVRIGGDVVDPAQYDNPRAQRLVEREFNLSWAADAQGDNRIVAGQWWSDAANATPQVSVEEGIAETLGLAIGDELTFLVGGQTVSAPVTSLRSVDWDSFNVNFFVIFPPGVIDDYPSQWITSFYLPPTDKPVLAALVRAFPSITVIDVEAVMTQVREIMQRVTLAVEYIFGFTVLAGLTVLFAAIQATHDARRQESAMLRTLGAGRRLVLKSLAAEFVLLGALAGVLAALVATVTGYVLAETVFDIPYTPGLAVWVVGLVGGGLGIGLAGLAGTRQVLNQPPMRTLRAI